jgi:Saxitoxin biosynthesis operon protein SxtJ
LQAPPELDRAGLRKFGLATGGMFVLTFGLLLPWLFGLRWPAWPWWVAGALALPALVWPPSLAPVYRIWMRMADVLGRINSWMLLAAVFYLVFTPFGAVRRLLGSDPMRRRIGAKGSYREPSTKRDPKSLERPY